MDANNYNLGLYLMRAFNAPRKYPPKPFLAKQESSGKVMSDEQMRLAAKRNTILMGGKIIKNNGNKS